MDKPQPSDAEKALAFARELGVGCRLCGHPMQGKHMQCVNPKCVWLGTTLADQTGIGAQTPRPPEAGSTGD